MGDGPQEGPATVRQQAPDPVTTQEAGMARKKAATGRSVDKRGYVRLWMPDHHLADKSGYVYEHRLVAENAIGRPLRPGEEVHHTDLTKSHNTEDNLEVEPSSAWHKFAHRKPDSRQKRPDEVNRVVSCACGCGDMMTRYDRWGRPRIYAHGHNRRKPSEGSTITP